MKKNYVLIMAVVLVMGGMFGVWASRAGGAGGGGGGTISTPVVFKFSSGDNVRLKALRVDVYPTASFYGTTLSYRWRGATGVITGGPTLAEGYNWWKIKWSDGVEGWSVDSPLNGAAFYFEKFFISTRFSSGDNVRIALFVGTLYVRPTPSVSQTALTEKHGGYSPATGVITGGPTLAEGYNWWKIKWSDGVEGWSVEGSEDGETFYLEKFQSPPSSSAIVGTTSVVVGVDTSWSVTATDLEGGALTYVVDWGDGTVSSSYTGVSGVEQTFSHAYTTIGSKTIQVTVRDVQNLVVSKSLTVTVSAVTSPSTKFKIGDNVLVTSQVGSSLNVQPSASFSQTRLGIETPKEAGTITGGPVLAEGYNWWKIKWWNRIIFNYGGEGWSPEGSLDGVNFYIEKIAISTRFSVGDRVWVPSSSVSGVFVEPTASFYGTTLSYRWIGDTGIITGGPVLAEGYNWWKIKWSDGVEGWSQEGSQDGTVFYLERVRQPMITDINGPTTLVAGQLYTWSVGSYISSGYFLSYSVDWGDNASTTQSDNFLFTHAYSKIGTYTATFTVTFTVSNVVESVNRAVTMTVVVNNDPPVISGVTGPTALMVGQSGTWAVAASDPNSDVLSYSVAWGDGATTSAQSRSNFYHTYLTAGNYTARFTVNDGKGGVANSDEAVTVSSATGGGGTTTSTTGGGGTSTSTARFAIGDHVQVMNVGYLRVKSSPSDNQIHFATKTVLNVGVVTDGPVMSDGYNWWKIKWDIDDIEGWSIEGVEGGTGVYLKKFFPSTRFSVGDKVKASYSVQVYSDYSWAMNVLATEQQGSLGAITDGPKTRTYTLWKIKWDNGYEGWSNEGELSGGLFYLEKVLVAGEGFSIGDKVRSTQEHNIRENPSLRGNILGIMPRSSEAWVLEGPVAADGYNWWKLKLENMTVVWSAGNYLEKSGLVVGGGRPTGPAPNSAPYGLIFTPLDAGVGQITNFQLGGSDYNPAGFSTISYEVNWGDGTPLGRYSGTSGEVVSASHTYANAGTFTVQLKATDAQGLSSVTRAYDASSQVTVHQPSVKFAFGDKAKVTSRLIVRDGANGAVTGSQRRGASGKIVGGPVFADGYWWWQVDYDLLNDGWSAENWLMKQGAPPIIDDFSGPAGVILNVSNSWNVKVSDPDGGQLKYSIDWGDSRFYSVYDRKPEGQYISVPSGSGGIYSHKYSKAGTYTLKLTVMDIEGFTAAKSLSVVVATPTRNTPPSSTSTSPATTSTILTSINQPPMIESQSLISPVSVKAGSVQSWRVFVYDPDKNVPITYRVTWGDGTADVTDRSIYNNDSIDTWANHAYTNAGVYTITITATDSKGASATKTLAVTVMASTATSPSPTSTTPTSTIPTNQSPSNLAITGLSSVTAGVGGSWQFVGYDSNDATITYSVNWGDGIFSDSVNWTSGVSRTQSHTYTAAGTYTITFNVTDPKGASTTKTFAVAVTVPIQQPASTPSTNQPPTVSGVAGPTSLSPGQSGTWTVFASDPNSDTLSYGATWGDGSTSVVQSGTSFTHIYTTVGTYTATFAVSDGKGGSVSRTVTVTISTQGSTPPTNQPPTQPLITGVSSVNANVAGSWQVKSTDPEGSVITYTITWGDGAVASSYTGASGALVTITHTYTQAASRTISVTAKDSSGLSTLAIGSLGVTVSATSQPPVNQSPSVPIITGPSSVTVGIASSWQIKSTDPEGSAITYTVKWDSWPGSGGVVYTGVSGQSVTITHTYSGAAIETMIVTAKDSSGATSALAKFTVTVLAPSQPTVPAPTNLMLGGSSTAKAGSGDYWYFSATDPNRRMLYYFIDWGDGKSGSSGGVVSSGYLLNRLHYYTNIGTYTIRFLATNYEGTASAEKTLTVTVTSPTGSLQSPAIYTASLVESIKFQLNQIASQLQALLEEIR